MKSSFQVHSKSQIKVEVELSDTISFSSSFSVADTGEVSATVELEVAVANLVEVAAAVAVVRVPLHWGCPGEPRAAAPLRCSSKPEQQNKRRKNRKIREQESK